MIRIFASLGVGSAGRPGRVDRPAPLRALWALALLLGVGTATVALAAPGTVDVRIAVSADDAEQIVQNGKMTLNGRTLELVTDGKTVQTIGLRFRNVLIPRGAKITKAYVQFTSDAATSGGATLTFRAHDVDDSGVFTTSSRNISNRATTSVSVNWSPPSWSSGQAGAAQATPDLSALIQAIVNRSGWSSGNALSLIITGSGTRAARAYDYSSSQAPLLRIEYDDTSPPTVPTGLQATSVTSISIALGWNASTDNGSVVGYRVFRNGALRGEVGPTSFTDTNLSPGTTYSYTVAAVDNNGNVSAQSSALAVTTPPAPDTIPPSVPGNLSASAISATQVSVTWSVSTDNVAVAGYHVFRDGVQQASVGGTSFTDTGLAPSTTYTYAVRAVDTSGNVSALSSSRTVTTPSAPDTTPPSVPGNLAATVVSQTAIDLTWSASTDNVGVTGYRVYRNNVLRATVTTTAYSDTGLTGGVTYTYAVDAIDAAGNASAKSSTVSATTPAPPDTTPPSVPTGLTATGVSSSGVNLSWQASTDNVGVVGYRVYRGNTVIGTPTTTSYSDSGLSSGTTYTYAVDALDLAGNASAKSASISVTTSAPPAQEPIIFVGTGDIAYDGPADELTARVVDQVVAQHPNAVVFTLGDNAYPSGTAAEFANYYHPTWGRHKARTRPSPGNHDYRSPNAQPYFDYFGAAAGPPGLGYYSYNLGEWHIISLNSEIDTSETSPQMQWLRQNLAANPRDCILAYWHVPRFSSGINGSEPLMHPVWKLLYEHGADVILSGHDHLYERFAPMNALGAHDPEQGMRQFIVGTGGVSLYSFLTPLPTSEVRNNTSYGVIKFTLHSGRYDWEFIPIQGHTFTDRGSGTCTTTLPPPPPLWTQTRIAASSDDVEEEVATGSVYINSSDIDMVTDEVNILQVVGMRFTQVQVPRGARILDAYIQFRARDSGSVATSLTFRGEAADNPATYTTLKNDVTRRPMTSASVNWSPPAWVARDTGPAQKTPSLAPIVQELVNRPGWASGNAMSITVRGSGQRSARSCDYHPSDAPLLYIEYELPN